ncbi:MAG TPA: hypothetical protein VHW65_05200, partial [Gemmatimonadales bacterium]|nr:hypothetical protein [Gemmatimonadales bacterium]
DLAADPSGPLIDGDLEWNMAALLEMPGGQEAAGTGANDRNAKGMVCHALNDGGVAMALGR